MDMLNVKRLLYKFLQDLMIWHRQWMDPWIWIFWRKAQVLLEMMEKVFPRVLGESKAPRPVGCEVEEPCMITVAKMEMSIIFHLSDIDGWQPARVWRDLNETPGGLFNSFEANSGRFVRRLRSVLVRGRHEETRVLHWIPFFAPNFLLNCHRLFEAASTVSAPIASTPKQNHQQRQEEKKTTWMRSGDKKTVGGKTTVYS